MRKLKRLRYKDFPHPTCKTAQIAGNKNMATTNCSGLYDHAVAAIRAYRVYCEWYKKTPQQVMEAKVVRDVKVILRGVDGLKLATYTIHTRQITLA